MILLILYTNYNGCCGQCGYKKSPWVVSRPPEERAVRVIKIRVVSIIPAAAISIWRPGVRAVNITPYIGVSDIGVIYVNINISVAAVNIVVPFVANIVSVIIPVVYVGSISIAGVVRPVKVGIISAAGIIGFVKGCTLPVVVRPLNRF